MFRCWKRIKLGILKSLGIIETMSLQNSYNLGTPFSNSKSLSNRFSYILETVYDHCGLYQLIKSTTDNQRTIWPVLYVFIRDCNFGKKPSGV